MEKEEVKCEPEAEVVSDQWLREWVEPENDKKDVVKRDVEEDMMDTESQEEIELAEEVREKVATEKLQPNTAINLSDRIGKKFDKSEKIVSNESKGHKIDMICEKICSSAPVLSDRFSNKCLFQCPKCNDQLKSWHMLWSHCGQNHPRLRLSLLEVDQYLTKPVAYICKICSMRCLSDNVFLSRHLRIHKMSIRHYKDEFETPIPQTLPEIMYSEHVIGNLCLYQCQKCKHCFRSKETLQSHHRKYMMDGEKLNITASIRKIVHHHCKICQSSIQCQLLHLKNHFEKFHDLSIEKYCKDNGCTLEKRHRKSSILEHDESSQEVTTDNEGFISKSSSCSGGSKNIT